MLGEVNNAFFVPLSDSFFLQHGNHLSPQFIKKNAAIPFRDHTQFPLLVDSLIRKHSHHLLLQTDLSGTILVYFLEALLQQLAQDSTPPALRECELLYLTSDPLNFTNAQQQSIKKDFQTMLESLTATNKCLLFAIHDHLLLDPFLGPQFERLSHHPQCRLLVITHDKKWMMPFHLNHRFTSVTLTSPRESDMLAIMKQQRTELENFHHVLIPEELLTLAYAFAERYLSSHDTLAKALLLLDTSAARTRIHDHLDTNTTSRPIVTSTTLVVTLSSWTHIPLSHLPLNKLKLSEFMSGMQQRIFGQDTALTLLHHELQQSQVHLQQTTGPLCSLLFCGPNHSGKQTVALALAEQLFKQPNVLYCAAPLANACPSLLTMKLQRAQDHHTLLLKDVIQQTPYAIIFVEDIEKLSPALLDSLYELINTGLLYDEDGNAYNFRQAILILSTTLGTHKLTILSQVETEEETAEMDLMQLIMNEQQRPVYASSHALAPQELAHEALQDLMTHLPASLCQSLRLIPFVPLTRTAVEQIIRLKLKLLTKLLDSRYGVEFSYAPEIIRYLANNALLKQESPETDKAIKLLYFTIEQAILSQAENKNRPNQLFLQLNETGQALKCDWLVVASTMRHHTS